jgi:hypothetical protein
MTPGQHQPANAESQPMNATREPEPPRAGQPEGQAQPGDAQPADLPRTRGRREPRPYLADWAIEVWIHPQLREWNPRRPLSLWEALEVGHDREPRRQPERDLEPEAEP